MSRHSDKISLRVALAALMLIVVGVARLAAQYQVNPQVNNRPNNVVYGGGTSGSVRYAGVNPSIAARTSVPMDSEFRYEYRKAGETPSSIRMGYAAIGPMAEGGPTAYINYKPSYLSKQSAPLPPPTGAAAYSSMGSIRYASPTAAPTTALASPALASPAPIDAMVKPPKPVSPSVVNYAAPTPIVPSSAGSIRYAP